MPYVVEIADVHYSESKRLLNETDAFLVVREISRSNLSKRGRRWLLTVSTLRTSWVAIYLFDAGFAKAELCR